MSGPTRKAIAAALLAQLAPAGSPFANVGRRLRDPEGSAKPGAPALYLIKPLEKVDRLSPLGLPKRDLHFLVVIYTDVGEDETAIPADVIDDLLDYVDGQLTPSGADGQLGRVTLGGLVHSVLIDGDINFAPGDTTGKGETVIPIRIMMP